MLPVNFAFSPCPNDTFAFHAIVHGLVPGIRVTPHLDDIEALNIRAAGPEAEVTKVSINAYGHGLRDRYILLRSGGAAGFGVGPIIVASSKRDVGGRIAIPGERTTAALLLRQLGRFDTVVMRDAGHPCCSRSRTRRTASVTAQIAEPEPITSATIGKPYPAVNNRPASAGAAAEIPRPTPMTAPVAPARKWVGNSVATRL